MKELELKYGCNQIRNHLRFICRRRAADYGIKR